MMRFITSIILIGLSIAVFFVVSVPTYNDIAALKAQVASYDQALANSKALENAKDELTHKQSSIKPADLIKIQKLLPDNVDNIRLILQIQNISAPYGMVLKDVRFNAPTPAASPTANPAGPAQQASAASSKDNKDYGTWDLSFSTTGSYSNFLNFTRDLQKNLRIVDVASVQFSSDLGDATSGVATAGTSPLSATYKYDFKIKTYWLKK